MSAKTEVQVPPVDPTVEPAKDFYTHVNHRWHQHTRLPGYEDSFGVSEEIEMEVRDKLLEAVEDLIRTKPSHGLAVLATSFLDDGAQASSIHDLKHLVAKIDCAAAPADLGEFVGMLNRFQCKAPISFVVNSDYYDSRVCCVYIYEATLGLPTKTLYTEAKGHGAALNHYRRLLTTLGKLLEVEDLTAVIETETALLPVISEHGDVSSTSYSYLPHSLHDLEREYPAIPWRGALRGWGLRADRIDSIKFIVTNARYLHVVNRMFSGPVGPFATWLRTITILYFLKYLPPPFDDLHYELFERRLKGNRVKLPQKQLTLRVLMNFAQQDLSHLFVAAAVPAATRRRATTLVHHLAAATAERIRGLAWMEAATKAQALEKVRKMAFQVAYPTDWDSEIRELGGARHLDATRPFQNLLALAASDTEKMIGDLMRGHCRKTAAHWIEGAFEVNAYYYPEGNLMIIPAGILRPPFFDLTRSDAWNLGGIGAAIGHEITHGFDDDGRNYDESGSYADWWSVSDAATYRRMAGDVERLFEGAEYMGGHVSGKLTLSENLADLGGLAIALTALKDLLRGAPLEEMKKAYREFFISYAVSWRQIDRPEKARQALSLDVHAPPPLRVNMIVRQFQEFYDAFDVPSDAAGVIPPSERIQFW